MKILFHLSQVHREECWLSKYSASSFIPRLSVPRLSVPRLSVPRLSVPRLSERHILD